MPWSRYHELLPSKYVSVRNRSCPAKPAAVVESRSTAPEAALGSMVNSLRLPAMNSSTLRMQNLLLSVAESSPTLPLFRKVTVQVVRPPAALVAFFITTSSSPVPRFASKLALT